jgi:hypothetical protein
MNIMNIMNIMSTMVIIIVTITRRICRKRWVRSICLR